MNLKSSNKQKRGEVIKTMSKLEKYAAGLFLSGALLVMTGLTANAQRGGAHASGGGGNVAVGRGGGGGFGGGGISIGRGFGGGYRGGLNWGLGLGFGRNNGFYRPGLGVYGYPHVGFYLNTLPYGYYPFYFGSDLYYYAGGAFYRPYDNGYVVTTPPVGASVPQLPRGAKPIKIDGQDFYEYQGVYYSTMTNDKGETIYVVAGKNGTLNTGSVNNGGNNGYNNLRPRVGDVVKNLPDDCRRVKLDGQVYFVSPDEIYYVAIYDAQGNEAYRIASIEDDGNDN